MRCCSCDKALSDREAVRKAPITKEYMDLCDVCLAEIAEDLGMELDVVDITPDSEGLADESVLTS